MMEMDLVCLTTNVSFPQQQDLPQSVMTFPELEQRLLFGVASSQDV